MAALGDPDDHLRPLLADTLVDRATRTGHPGQPARAVRFGILAETAGAEELLSPWVLPLAPSVACALHALPTMGFRWSASRR